MALWKDQKDSPATAGETSPPAAAEPIVRAVERSAPASTPAPEPAPKKDRAAAASHANAKESLIAADVTIEGKIEGAGHVRIAGRFKGDVNVEGNVTIEQGAHVTGQVHANTVIVSGEVNGNIDASSKVELLETGVINGDVKAGTLTVVAGSRMRGQADFGWTDKGGK
jgi:cytoskeletal protein CcmA (bactofilin family)